MSIRQSNKGDLVSKCQQLGLTHDGKDETDLIKLIITKMTENSLDPLIKWSGGKSDELLKFRTFIPLNYDRYIEPFIGGGALYFHLNPEKAVISDVHTELIDLYREIAGGNAREIHQFMLDNPNDEETYYNVRDKMEINDSLDNAKRFYYQRKTAYRGMLRYNRSGRFNIPFGKYKKINFQALLDVRYQQLLERTEIIHGGFEEVFEKFNDSGNFVFLDPPYDSEFTDYGYCSFGKDEHIMLAKCFKETKNKCLMVIGKTDFIVDLYKDYIVGQYDKKYKFKLHSGRVGSEIDTKHLVIKNY